MLISNVNLEIVTYCVVFLRKAVYRVFVCMHVKYRQAYLEACSDYNLFLLMANFLFILERFFGGHGLHVLSFFGLFLKLFSLFGARDYVIDSQQ